jgi:hypothetical protein
MNRASKEAERFLGTSGKAECGSAVGYPLEVVSQEVEKGVDKATAESLAQIHGIKFSKKDFDIERDFAPDIIRVTCRLSGPKGATDARVYMLEQDEDTMVTFSLIEIEPVK